MLPSDGASWSRINRELSVVSAKYLKAVYLILGIQHLIFNCTLFNYVSWPFCSTELWALESTLTPDPVFLTILDKLKQNVIWMITPDCGSLLFGWSLQGKRTALLCHSEDLWEEEEEEEGWTREDHLPRWTALSMTPWRGEKNKNS